MALERRLKLVTKSEVEPEMKTVAKVAFATSDMKQVDQHFGVADAFAVYVLNPERITFAEAVQFTPVTMNNYPEDDREPGPGGDRNTPPRPGASGHDENRLASRIDALDGCVAVYCRAVGASAMEQLLVKGIQAVKVASGAEIKSLLEALQEDLRSGAGTWLGRALARQQPIDSRRFDDMEQEGWVE